MPQAELIQDDFSVGIVRGVGPQAIDPRALRDHINGLYEDDGGLYKRGGSTVHSDQIPTPASNPETWIWDGIFDVGRRTVAASPNDFFVVDADDHSMLNLGSDGLTVPKRSELIESMLFIGGGYIYGGSRKTATYTTGTITLTNGSKTVTGSGTTWNTLVDAGMLLQRGSERVYVVASVDSTTQITLRDAYEGVTGAGVSYTLSPLYKMTGGDPYKIGDFYAVVGKRLITGIGSTFWFSEIQRPHVYSITIGSTTYPDSHPLPEGVKITGLGVIRNTVLIFTTGGIWTLTGLPFDIVDAQGNTNHRLEVLSREFIAFGQSATWQQTLIVPCLEGIFAIDGVSSPRRISRPMEELYRVYVDAGYRPGKMAVYNGCLILPIITVAGAVKDILVARLDRETEVAGQRSFPWSRMTGPGVDCPAFAVRYDDASGIRTLLGANRTLARSVNCSGWWAPDGTNTLDADGTAPQWSIVTRDTLTGNHTSNYVRTIRPRYELDGTGATITGEYGFGLESTAGPRFGQVNFGGFNLASSDLEIFYPLSCTFGESDGLDPQHCGVDVDTRLIRYRFRNANACNSLRLRSIEQFIRPSQATRR